MGLKQSNQKLSKKPVPVDIQFRKVKGKNDQYFKSVEETANLFLNYNFEEIIYLLLSFQSNETNEELQTRFKEYNLENKIVTKKDSVEIIKECYFLKFLESKIIHNPLVNQDSLYVGNSGSKDLNLFKGFYGYFYTYLHKTYKNFFKDFYGHKIHSSDDYLPKVFLLPLAFYYGQAQMRVKIEVFFNFLANGKDSICSIDFNLRALIFALLSCASGSSLLALNDLAKDDQDVRKQFSEDEFVRIYDLYQVKDCLRVTEEVICKLFEITNMKEFKEIDIEVFKWHFTKGGFYWLFYPEGVRNYLESHPE